MQQPGAAEIVDGASRVEFESDEPPLLIHHWVGRPSRALVIRYYDHLREIEERGEPFVLITDATGVGVPGAAVRQEVATQNLARVEHRHLTVGSVVVVTNPLVRGALTAITWLDSSLEGTEYVATMPEAKARARQLIESIDR